MCVDVDEPWDIFNSWRAVAKCADCGWTGPGWTEERGPEEVETDPDYGRGLIAQELVLNDGTPDWVITADSFYPFGPDADWEIHERWSELIDHIPPIVEGSSHICDNCVEARRWLETWCHSYWFDRYLDDIAEHWDEDEITHSLRTGRLVVAVKNRWKLRGRRLTKDEAAKLVDESLAALRELTAA